MSNPIHILDPHADAWQALCLAQDARFYSSYVTTCRTCKTAPGAAALEAGDGRQTPGPTTGPGVDQRHDEVE